MAAHFFTNKLRLNGFFIELFFSMMLIPALRSTAEKGAYLVCLPIILLVDGGCLEQQAEASLLHCSCILEKEARIYIDWWCSATYYFRVILARR